MDLGLLLRMRVLVAMVTVVVLALLWTPGALSQKPFSPYDSSSYQTRRASLLSSLFADSRPSASLPKCLGSGSVCNPWWHSSPCCEGTTCRTYTNSNCMGIEDCWCRPTHKVFGFSNWYRK